MSDCLFCQIADKRIPADVIYEDSDFVIFKDIYPKADIHWLVIPKQHYQDLNDMATQNSELLGRMMQLVAKITQDKKIGGYRTILNTGKEGGQEIFHIHTHILAGRNLPVF